MALAVLFFLLALAASVAGAISGIGGGVLLKPLLDGLTGFDLNAISLLTGCMVLSMAAVSLLRTRKTGMRIEKGRGTLLALGSVLGGLGGKGLFDRMRAAFQGDWAVGMTQSLLLVGMTLAVFVYIQRKDHIVTRDIRNPLLRFLTGAGLGMLSAFLGIGGGPLNIMALSYLLSMDSKACTLHSLYIVLCSQLTGLVTMAAGGSLPRDVGGLLLGAMAAGGILGGLAGSRILRRIGNQYVDRLLSVVLLLVAAAAGRNFVSFWKMG